MQENMLDEFTTGTVSIERHLIRINIPLIEIRNSHRFKNQFIKFINIGTGEKSAHEFHSNNV